MRYLLAIAIAALPTLAFAASDEAPSSPSLNASSGTFMGGHIRLGDCSLTEDPESNLPPLPAVCIKATTGSDAGLGLGREADNAWDYWGRAYAGVYPFSLVSFHARATFVRRTPFLGRDRIEEPGIAQTQAVRRPDELVVQVGNPATTNLRASIGRQAMPFGLDLSPIDEFYEVYKTEEFWRSPPYGLKLTYDNQTNWQIDVATATGSDIRHLGRAASLPNDAALVVRGMFDFSYLEGARFSVSTYADRLGERRLGLGLVNVNLAGDLTYVEWVRLRLTPAGRTGPDHRVFRIGYLAAFRQRRRWLAEYEDAVRQYRMAMLGHDFLVWPQFALRVSFAYFKALRPGDKSRLLFVSGFEAHL